MKKHFITVAAFFLMCGFAVITNGQTTDAEFDLMQRAQMVAEIKDLRTKNAAKDTIIAEQKNTIDVYKRLDEKQEARISDLKEALKYRTEANNIDVKVENLFRSQIEDYKTENLRLRDENAKLRKSRDRRSLIFGAIGIAAGKFLW